MFLKRDIYFLGLVKIIYVRVIGEYFYVGGVGGIYWYWDNVSDFYLIVVLENQFKDVECIIKDSEGMFWVVVGGLFMFDEIESELCELVLGKFWFSFD